MKPCHSLLVLLFLACLLLSGRAFPKGIFPYPFHTKTLDNGLQVVMVPYDSPGIVAYYSIVRTGSRNEIEPGKSGFAHFFEHMMFRGTRRYPSEEYNELFKALGSDANAYTTDDYTCYHAVFGKEGLEKVIEAEADRFRNLEYSLSDFQQEAKAVLGEYNKNYSNPFSKLYEKLRDTAFTTHSYKHTTMGFLKDIEDMPNQYEYSLEFYKRWYRPDNVILLVVGDIEIDRTYKLIEKHYGSWEPSVYNPEFPVEPEQKEFRRAHIDWKNETLPYIAIAYHVPAFEPSKKENAGIDVLAELLFGENSPLYKKLVIEDQSVEYVSAYVPDHRDPFLFIVFARVKEDKLMEKVKEDIYSAIEKVKGGTLDPKRLEAIKSRIKYSFAMRLDTAAAIAQSLTPYLQLTGDPETVNEIYRRYDEITPEKVQSLARRYLVKNNCAEVTLTGVKN